MPPVIEARGLVKTFHEKRPLAALLRDPWGKGKRIEALRGVDLEVADGEIVSLLGPNGAGKTTLLKILTCLVLPDAGTARVCGIETQDERRVKPRIGLVQTDERSFYWRLSARQNLRFFARLYDVPASAADDRIGALLERLDLGGAADRPFSGYSSGMKQRVAIARALLHDPPVVFMDEPTRSLDPAATLEVRRFVLDELRARDRKTILIATHDLSEAAAISDRVAILAGGRIVEVGTVEQVRRWGVADSAYELTLAGGVAPPESLCRIVERFDEGRRERFHVVMRSEVGLHELLAGCVAAGARIEGCRPFEPNLEQAFAKILASRPQPTADQAANAADASTTDRPDADQPRGAKGR